MMRATTRPVTPPTTKYTVVASDIDVTAQPRSRLNAFR
jgi:hypothetical protein